MDFSSLFKFLNQHYDNYAFIDFNCFSQVSDVAHGPLVFQTIYWNDVLGFFKNCNYDFTWNLFIIQPWHWKPWQPWTYYSLFPY